MAVEQRRDLGELALPPDEARERDRHIRPPRAQRAKRWERPRQVADDDLIDPLGTIDVAQTVRAEVDELDGRGQPLAGEDGGDCRAEDLAAVPDREDPCGAVQSGPEIVSIADFRDA